MENNDGVLYEDEAVVIRFRSGFLENPDAFEVGEGVEHSYKNATATVDVKK